MANKLPCIISITILVLIIHLRATIPAELSKNIMVIARHGSLEGAPENTFTAFKQALNKGVDGLEVDVRRTKDDRLILMHDDTIDRTTNGKGYVNNLLYDEIRLYDAGAWKGEEFAGERVPLLSDVLQFVKERNVKIILNVKEHGIELKTLSLIEKFDMIDQIYFSGRLDKVRSKDIGVQGTQLVFILPNELTNKVIDFMHEKHKHVGTRLFNTDDRDKMKELMTYGVDLILTDFPSVAIDILHYRTKSETANIEPKKEGLEPDIEGNTGQIEGLIDAIVQGSPDQSRMAAFVISTLPAGLVVPQLIKLLTYRKPLKRFFPKPKLHFPFRKNDRQEKKNLLPATLVQQNIVWALGLIKNESAVGPLMKRLETAESDLKREIIQALKMIGDKEAVPALNEILLKDKNHFIRYDAARALGNIGSTDSIFTLIKALNDKNWMVKGACAGALAGTDDKRAIKKLKSILNTDAGYEASWARDRAAWSLARMGDEGLGALVSSLGKTGGRRACWALVKIGDSAIPYMLTTLRGAGGNARRRAAIALGWIGSKEAVVPLTWALTDKDSEVRKAAAWALGRIGETNAIAALKQALGDHNKKVAEYTEEAIERINYNLKERNGKEL
ncbi:MAG: HEAT repeat domain-containing protein [Candidatus Scalindua sp.]